MCAFMLAASPAHRCVVDAYVVDEVGGEAANMLAMYGAWRNLAAAQPDFVLIDGKGLPKVRPTL